MKRAADAISDPPASKVATRVTRSATRLVQLQTERDQEYAEKEQERLEKANALMATPLLQALPLVFGRSGFLYKCECRNAALVSKSWKSIVVECQHEIPRDNQVQISITYDKKGTEPIPTWVTHRGLEDVLPTQEFSRAIFEKLCNLKVAAEPTERKKQKMRDSLPKWGEDFLGLHMFVWGATLRNSGGIHLEISRFSDYGRSGLYVMDKIKGWSIRLDKYLRLWTWGPFRRWQRIYDGEPLFGEPLWCRWGGMFLAEGSDDDSDSDDE